MFINKHKNSIIILPYKYIKVKRKNFLIKKLTITDKKQAESHPFSGNVSALFFFF